MEMESHNTTDEPQPVGALMGRRRFLALLGGAGALGVAGCSSGEGTYPDDVAFEDDVVAGATPESQTQSNELATGDELWEWVTSQERQESLNTSISEVIQTWLDAINGCDPELRERFADHMRSAQNYPNHPRGDNVFNFFEPGTDLSDEERKVMTVNLNGIDVNQEGFLVISDDPAARLTLGVEYGRQTSESGTRSIVNEWEVSATTRKGQQSTIIIDDSRTQEGTMGSGMSDELIAEFDSVADIKAFEQDALRRLSEARDLFVAEFVEIVDCGPVIFTDPRGTSVDPDQL